MSLENITNARTGIALSALLAMSAATFTGCGPSVEEGQALGISKELQSEWPIWKQSELEINKYKGTAVSYDITLNEKPAFYTGSMPLQYVNESEFRGGGMDFGKTYLKFKFPGFTDYFVYNDMLVSGAVAVDNNNSLVAEAKITYEQDASTHRLKPKMEEFQYSNGLLVYHCLSEIDSNMGFKTSESEQSGKKQGDYFFILPMGISE